MVSVLLWKQSRALTMTGIALSLILGGAVGNLWDRVASGRVVDFLLFYVKTISGRCSISPIARLLSARLLVLEILFTRPEEHYTNPLAQFQLSGADMRMDTILPRPALTSNERNNPPFETLKAVASRWLGQHGGVDVRIVFGLAEFHGELAGMQLDILVAIDAGDLPICPANIRA